MPTPSLSGHQQQWPRAKRVGVSGGLAPPATRLPRPRHTHINQAILARFWSGVAPPGPTAPPTIPLVPATSPPKPPRRSASFSQAFVNRKISLIVASRYRLRECTTPLAIRLLVPTRCYTHIVAMSNSGELNRLNRFLTAVLARFQAAQTPWFPCTKKHKATGPTFFRSR